MISIDNIFNEILDTSMIIAAHSQDADIVTKVLKANIHENSKLGLICVGCEPNKPFIVE